MNNVCTRLRILHRILDKARTIKPASNSRISKHFIVEAGYLSPHADEGGFFFLKYKRCFLMFVSYTLTLKFRPSAGILCTYLQINENGAAACTRVRFFKDNSTLQ